MHEGGKSYSPVVPAKLPNKVVPATAEAVEGRGLAKGNTTGTTRSGLRAGMRVSHGLDRVRDIARKDKAVKFTALLHHVSVESLRNAYLALRPQAAPGVDGTTWRSEEHTSELQSRGHLVCRLLLEK